MKVLHLFIALSVISTSAYATEEIMKTYRGVRSLGMGGVVTTTGVYDEALFANPATAVEADHWKLSLINITAEANANLVSDIKTVSSAKGSAGSDTISKITDAGIAGKNEHLRLTLLPGFYSPHFLNFISISIGLLVNVQTNIMMRSNINLQTQTYIDAGPAIGLAKSFLHESLDIGVNVRTMYRLAGDPDLRATNFLAGQKLSVSSIGGQGMGVDGDVGTFYHLPVFNPIARFSVGASVNNVMASKYNTGGKFLKAVTTAPPPNDRTYALGLRTDFPDLFIIHDNFVALEVQDIGTTRAKASFWKKTHMGMETRLFRFIPLRAGFNQGYVTFGAGLDLPLLKIDLATYGEELGTNAGQLEDRRYVARICIDI